MVKVRNKLSAVERNGTALNLAKVCPLANGRVFIL